MQQIDKLEAFLLENDIEHKTIYESLKMKQGSYYNALSNSRKESTPLWIRAFNLGVKLANVSRRNDFKKVYDEISEKYLKQ